LNVKSAETVDDEDRCTKPQETALNAQLTMLPTDKTVFVLTAIISTRWYAIGKLTYSELQVRVQITVQ